MLFLLQKYDVQVIRDVARTIQGIPYSFQFCVCVFLNHFFEATAKILNHI